MIERERGREGGKERERKSERERERERERESARAKKRVCVFDFIFDYCIVFFFPIFFFHTPEGHFSGSNTAFRKCGSSSSLIETCQKRKKYLQGKTFVLSV